MGHVTTNRHRDLSGHETLYEHPEARRLLSLDRKTVVVLESGSSIEAIGGIAAIVLAVLGIAGFEPFAMGAASTIAVGTALLAQSGAIASRWRAKLRLLEGARYERNELLGGIGTEMFGGLVGVVLGALALAGVVPLVLVAIAAIVFGGALLLGGAAQPELGNLAAPPRAKAVQDALETSGGVMVLIGIASAVLGILSLLRVGPALTLTLIAMVCNGASLVFAGGALAARFMRRYA